MPAARPRGRPFWIILLGGLLVAVGIVVQNAVIAAAALGGLGQINWPAIEFPGYVIEALGFFVAFLGVAEALRR
jgi:hypothetical protein